MKNLKDAKTTIYPSTTRGGKELPSSSALDSPSVLSKLATPKPASAINSDMLHVIDDDTSAMHDTYDETTSVRDTTVPLGEFLDEQLARARENEILETDNIDESDDEGVTWDLYLLITMKNLKDAKTTIYPSTTRGGKELPSSSALDSPSVLSKLATPKPASAINSDMLHVIDDDTSAMHDTYDETTSVRDTTVPLGEFLDEQLARARENEILETDNIDESDDEESLVIPKGYVFDQEASLAILACKDRYELKRLLAKWKDRYELKRLLAKWKQQSLNARMKPDPAFATSPIFVTDKDYEFSVDPDIITLVESDPFHGYESETVVAHLTKLNDIATLFTKDERTRYFYILKIFPFSLVMNLKLLWHILLN